MCRRAGGFLAAAGAAVAGAGLAALTALAAREIGLMVDHFTPRRGCLDVGVLILIHTDRAMWIAACASFPAWTLALFHIARRRLRGAGASTRGARRSREPGS